MTLDVIAVTDQLYTLCCYDNRTRRLEKNRPVTERSESSSYAIGTFFHVDFRVRVGEGSNGGKKEKKKKRERKGKVEEEGKKERKRKRKGKEQEAVLRKGNERNRKDGEAKPRSGLEPVLPFHGHATFHPDAAGYEEIDLTTIMHECYARPTREIDLRIYT